VRRKVFCASWADVFDNQVPEEWRADLWALIASTPNLDWLLLTKRPQNIAKMLPATWGKGWPNVWLGTTTENQAEANRRIPHLQSIPAVVRFLSAEPLLEAITPALNGIGWVICGGESGHNARYMEPAWAYSLREQCVKAGVKFFMKQMSQPKKNAIPADLMVRQWPAYNLGLSMAG
jgi:protein gp37